MSRGIVVAGTHSGSGKTTVTLGLMAALRNQGQSVQPFKCGPDFIDPTLHRLATGRPSPNLDLWMSGEPFVRQCFARHAAAADIAVVEGVMGCFDGGVASSAALAKFLKLPMVLVVDVRSMAESVAAVVKGFESLDPELPVAGVILNRVGSPRHLELLAGALKNHCRAELLGYLPRDTEFTLPHRHLGLHMGEEAPLGEGALARLAQTVARHVDLDRLSQLAATARVAVAQTTAALPTAGESVRIGVARDRAFCFYYQDNLDILRECGA
ncbi:MAG: cobyrinate a,c-diamide synthase, partial [Desulfobulbaceae bacterium]|nr:cobyrinate a,c-diamide synthase [Desulfobulbaceae bacterium]